MKQQPENLVKFIESAEFIVYEAAGELHRFRFIYVIL